MGLETSPFVTEKGYWIRTWCRQPRALGKTCHVLIQHTRCMLFDFKLILSCTFTVTSLQNLLRVSFEYLEASKNISELVSVQGSSELSDNGWGGVPPQKLKRTGIVSQNHACS